MAFPAIPTDDPDELLKVLASYWTQQFDAAADVENLAQALCLEFEQLFFGVYDHIDDLSLSTIRIDRRVSFEVVEALQTDVLANSQVPAYRYGDSSGLLYTQGNPVVYGQKTMKGYRIPLPTDVVSVALVCSGLNNPSAYKFHGADFEIDGTDLVLFDSPFESPFNARQILAADGSVDDVETTLVLYGVDRRDGNVAKEFGYAMNLIQPSTEAFLRTVRGAHQGITKGGSSESLRLFLSGVFDIPVTGDTEETVQYIVNDDRRHIITDKGVYTAPADSEFYLADTYSVGDVLAPRTYPFPVVEIQELRNNSTIPAYVPHITLAAAQSDPRTGITGPLQFSNSDMPVTVVTDAEGNNFPVFEVHGDTADVNAFWASMYSRHNGTSANVASFLKTASGSYPATINPAQFLVRHALNYNAVLFHVIPELYGPDAMATVPLGVLRMFYPPHMLLVVTGTDDTLVDSATFLADLPIFEVPADDTVKCNDPDTSLSDLVCI